MRSLAFSMSEGIDGVFVGVVDEVCWAEGFVRIFVLGLLRPMWKKDIQRIFKYFAEYSATRDTIKFSPAQ